VRERDVEKAETGVIDGRKAGTERVGRADGKTTERSKDELRPRSLRDTSEVRVAAAIILASSGCSNQRQRLNTSLKTREDDPTSHAGILTLRRAKAEATRVWQGSAVQIHPLIKNLGVTNSIRHHTLSSSPTYVVQRRGWTKQSSAPGVTREAPPSPRRLRHLQTKEEYAFSSCARVTSDG
jgi:hypothetical protein